MSNHLFFTRLLSHLQDIEPPTLDRERSIYRFD